MYFRVFVRTWFIMGTFSSLWGPMGRISLRLHSQEQIFFSFEERDIILHFYLKILMRIIYWKFTYTFTLYPKYQKVWTKILTCLLKILLDFSIYHWYICSFIFYMWFILPSSIFHQTLWTGLIVSFFVSISFWNRMQQNVMPLLTNTVLRFPIINFMCMRMNAFITLFTEWMFLNLG